MQTPLAAVLLSLASLQILPAQFQNPPPLLNVSGSAEVMVPPDEAYLVVGVETRDESIAVAAEDNASRVADAIAFLEESGVERKHILTDFVSVEPEFDRNISRVNPVSFIVRKSIQIKLTDVAALDSTITGVLAHGVNYIHGLQLHTSKFRVHRDAARALAAKAAREKAAELAKEMGVTVGKIHTLNSNDWTYHQGRAWGGMMGSNVSQNVSSVPGGSGPELSLGQISVSASVNIAFFIE